MALLAWVMLGCDLPPVTELWLKLELLLLVVSLLLVVMVGFVEVGGKAMARMFSRRVRRVVVVWVMRAKLGRG